MLTNSKQLTKQIVLIIVASCTALLLAVVVEAWTGPSGAPPASNISAPINLGPASQTKAGNISVTNLIADSICFGADCRTSWSEATSGATRIYCSAWELSAATAWNENATYWTEAQTLSGGAAIASCPAGKSLTAHSTTYFYSYGNDWSGNQNEMFYVQANYTTNAIACYVNGVAGPNHIAGMGLCM